jgi:hypothetical protein
MRLCFPYSKEREIDEQLTVEIVLRWLGILTLPANWTPIGRMFVLLLP